MCETDEMKKVIFIILGIIVTAGSFFLSSRISDSRITDSFYQAETENTPEQIKKVALTFDDGPNEEFTPKLLDGLKKRNVRATFFLLGKQAEEYPDLTKRISEEGHLIGCHAYEHKDLSRLTLKEACRQITDTGDLLYEITGQRPMFMRPPYGSCQEQLPEKTEMIKVLWDIDTVDWSLRNTDQVVRNTLKEVEDGSIILMHDEFQESVDAALQLADALEKEGYQLVTVEELILD